MRSAVRRAAALISKGQSERELQEEIKFHIETLAEEYRAKGMSAAEAQSAARRDFGGVEQMKEAYRDQRGVPIIETTFQDLRYGLRGLRRSPGFTAAVVLSLALGIGANTAIFSVFNTLMLRLLPVREPERLVSLYRVGGWGQGFTSYPLYQELRKHTDVFEGVLARSAPWRVRYSVRGASEQPEFLFREFVSANYFEVLGVKPALGRLLSGEESGPQAQPYVVLSHDFWRARFHGDPGVLGRQLVIDDQPLTIIGVAQKAFRGVQVEGRADTWVPITMHRARFQDAGMHWLWLLARLSRGTQPEKAQARIDVLVRNFLSGAYAHKPDTPWRRRSLEQRLELRDGGIGVSYLRDQFEKPLLLLMAVVVLILLIACLNVASLLLARGAARRREIAMRLALGASRTRLIRQWMTETSILAAMGTLAGMCLGIWGSKYLVKFLPVNEASLVLDVHPDTSVILFTAAVSLAALILFGLLPGLRATDVQLGAALKEGSSGSGRGGRGHVRKILVVSQVALSIILVSGATLFSRSLLALYRTDRGFQSDDVLGFQLDAPRSYKEHQIAAIRTRLVQSLEATPGVTAVSYGFPGPYRGGTWSAGIRVPGSERTAAEPASVELQSGAARYFETIGSRPLRGRDFEDNDTGQSRRVAIVNEAFAREYLNGTDPVGRVFGFDDKEPGGGDPVTIVGLVRDMLHNGVREHPVPTVYLPFTQTESASDPILLVSAGKKPETLIPTVGRALGAIDPAIALSGARTIRQRFDDSIFLDRMIASVTVLFAALSLIIAGVGLYGILSYEVVRRTQEIGIRMALGAMAKDVRWMVVRDGLLLVAAGAAIGIPIAAASARLARQMVFGIQPADPLTFVASLAFLLFVAVVAAGLPGRRASLVEPIQALRQD